MGRQKIKFRGKGVSRKLNYGGRGHLENNYFPGGGGQNYVLFPEGGLASNYFPTLKVCSGRSRESRKMLGDIKLRGGEGASGK